MNHFAWSWKQDGIRINAQGWNPPQVKGVVCLIHGFAEYGGRYRPLAKDLCAAGYAVIAPDLMGHGESEGKRGHVLSYEFHLDTVKVLLDEAATRFPGTRIFLYGHSMGGGIVTNFLLKRKPAIAGAIVTGPLYRVGFEPPAFKVFLAKLMRSIYPAFPEKANLDTDGLSRDKEVVRAYNQDPKVHNQITAGAFLGMFEAGLWDIENASQLSVPMLLMHGTADKLTSPEGSKEFAMRAPADLLESCWWEGYYHELHNEPEADRKKVVQKIVSWLDAH